MKHIMFIDDNFIGNPKNARKLIARLHPLGIKWNAAVSANIIDMPDLLDEMRDSGCQSLFIGFESIQAASIAGVHKIQNATAQYSALVEALHSRGIMINASFVFGLDSDTPETFQKTLDWIIEHRIETVTSHILTPYPGTVSYDQLRAQGRILTNDLSLYNTAHVVYQPQLMSPDELYQGYLWIYKEIYSIKNIIKRMPKAKHQRLPYLAFNLLYRKYGWLGQSISKCISYQKFGRWAQTISRYLKH